MKFFEFLGAALLTASIAVGIEFNPDDEESIKAVTRQYSYGLFDLYKNNASNTPPEDVGIFPQPYYWWEAGAAWDSSVLYSMFTDDTSHVKTVQQALTANYGPDKDFILSYRKSQTGNDDQAFWAQAVMSALEYQFPEPENAPASYLQVAENAFNNIVSRWDETSCSGGLKWQIYPENSYGYDYKNSISNGCAFALGARLARYTGNQTYMDWATKIYDWTTKVGLITDNFEVFDGADDKTDCKKIDNTQWSYNVALQLAGASFMFDITGDKVWKDRISGFLQHAQTLFFRPYENATGIMYEWACETGESGRHCNVDQQSFKAYLSRYMAVTATLAPFTKDTITSLLKTSAIGAAKSCSGLGSSTCGFKWYTGGFDGQTGVGEQLSALEVTQSLLMLKKGIVPAKKDAAKPAPSSSATPKYSSTPVANPNPGPSSQAPAPNQAPLPVTSTLLQSPPPPPSSSSTSSANPPANPIIPPNPSQRGGQFGEIHPSHSSCNATSPSCTCTPTTTTTIYINPQTLSPVPSAPPITPPNSTLPSSPSAPLNISVPSPSKPLEFLGKAASNGVVVGYYVFGAMFLVLGLI